jgi:hypothetical protein
VGGPGFLKQPGRLTWRKAMTKIIRIVPVQEVVETYVRGELKTEVKRHCTRVSDYQNYDITYDGEGRRVLEPRY